MARSRNDDDDDDRDELEDEDEEERRPRKSGRSNAAISRLAGPAICLIVVASLAVLGQCISIPMNIFAMTQPRPAQQFGGNDFAAQMNANPGLNIAFGVLFLAIQGFILFGAIQMKSGKMYGVSMAAAVLSVIPICSSCVCFGIPFGIWALIVLMDQNVKSAFTS